MLHLEILDDKRKDLLPLIAKAGELFYLAGGTALALQIGHRDSIDFDFFRQDDIDTSILWSTLENIFTGHTLLKTQDEFNTLSCIIDGEIRLSFFGYKYPLLDSILEKNSLHLASILDIGCMKLSAITSRATLKDYLDLYFILKEKPLTDLLNACTSKYPTLDHGLILKSLVYFDDLSPESIMFMPGFETSLDEIKNNLIGAVKYYWGN